MSVARRRDRDLVLDTATRIVEFNFHDSISAHDFSLIVFFPFPLFGPAQFQVGGRSILCDGVCTECNDLFLFDSITSIVKKYHIVYFSRTYKFLQNKT